MTSEVETRLAIEAGYARISAALATSDLESVGGIYAADFEKLETTGEVRDLAWMMTDLKQQLANMTDLSVLMQVDTIHFGGGEATVVVRVIETFQASAAWQKCDAREEETRHDTWVMGDGGWRLRRSEIHMARTWVNDKLLSEQVLVPPLTAEDRAAVMGDLGHYGLPFKTELAGNGFGDLECLDQIIGDARLVALGEASHGTAEFFRMKHRVFEYLVERKGFTVLAMEGNWPEAETADRFIKTGDGDAAAALAAMYFWTWQTEEVRDLLDAMRAYNARRGDRPQLSFAGFDMQYTKLAVARVLDYAARLSGPELDQVPQLYQGIDKLDARSQTDVPKSQLRDNAAAVLELFDARREALLDISTADDYRGAHQAARIVLQACEMHIGIGWAVRDRAMADNVQWLMEERFPGEKIVLWAHNGHVGTAPVGGEMSQGMFLRARYGERMVVLGFASHHGAIRAKRMVDGKMQPGAPVALPLAPVRTVSVEALFHAVGMARFVLDFRRIPKDSALGRWFGEPRLHRSIGAAYAPERDTNFYKNCVLPTTYDGIIFIAESTPAKPL